MDEMRSKEEKGDEGEEKEGKKGGIRIGGQGKERGEGGIVTKVEMGER